MQYKINYDELLQLQTTHWRHGGE